MLYLQRYVHFIKEYFVISGKKKAADGLCPVAPMIRESMDFPIIKPEKIFEKNEPFSRMVTLIYRCTETGKENMT